MTENRPGGQFDAVSGQNAPYGWSPPAANAPPPPPSGGVPVGRRPGALRVALMAATLIVGLAIGFGIGHVTRSTTSGPTSLVSPVPNPSSSTAAQAKILYLQATTAMSRSAGFHYESVSGGVSGGQTIVGDAGQHGGRQLITIDSGFGHEQFTLLLVAGTVYFQGNAPALQDQLGVSAAKAPAFQDKWISVASADGPYSVVAPGITVADQLKEMTLVPTSTLQVTTGGGVKATRIGGTVPAQQGAPAGKGHLDVATDSHLPISFVTTLTGNGVTLSTSTIFNAWGTPSSPTAPTGAVAWSTLGATPPPGGYGSGGASGGPTPAPSPGV